VSKNVSKSSRFRALGLAAGFTLIAPEYQRAVDAANAQAKADAEKKMPDL